MEAGEDAGVPPAGVHLRLEPGVAGGGELQPSLPPGHRSGGDEELSNQAGEADRGTNADVEIRPADHLHHRLHHSHHQLQWHLWLGAHLRCQQYKMDIFRDAVSLQLQN